MEEKAAWSVDESEVGAAILKGGEVGSTGMFSAGTPFPTMATVLALGNP